MTKTFLEKIFDVSNKVIVLTGSAGRVGNHFSYTLANAGVNLILIDKDKKILAKYIGPLNKNYYEEIINKVKN